MRVAIVDDDEISQRGLASILADTAGVDVTAVMTHADARQSEGRWEDVEVVVVDAADERDPLDQFPGVAVVEQVRRRRSAAQTTVLVLTGHFFDPALRRRMREAGADFLYHRGDLVSADALRQAVIHPAQLRPLEVPGDLDELVRHGVSGATRVNLAVNFAAERALVGGSGGSRAQSRARREFNQVARLSPMNRDGLPPNRDQTEPSRVQIHRFLQWATRIKGRPR